MGYTKLILLTSTTEKALVCVDCKYYRPVMISDEPPGESDITLAVDWYCNNQYYSSVPKKIVVKPEEFSKEQLLMIQCKAWIDGDMFLSQEPETIIGAFDNDQGPTMGTGY